MSAMHDTHPNTTQATSSTDAHARDPFLDMPLQGIRLIEASAGTGKTFTLATLVMRLVVEQGLRIGEILTVTFTEAATQELRERLRRRIQIAARVAAGQELEGDADDNEAALCRELVRRQQGVEAAPALAARLKQAVAELDTASVHTIHAFCRRVLGDHALEAGEAFGNDVQMASERELREQVAVDAWRTFAADSADAECLQALWKSPAGLADDLVHLLGSATLHPPFDEGSPAPAPDVQGAALALAHAHAAHGANARALLADAMARSVLNANSYKPATVEAVWAAFDTWKPNSIATFPHPRLELLSPVKLAACVRTGRDGSTLVSPLFDAVAAYLQTCDAHAAWLSAQKTRLIHRIRCDALQRLALAKRERGLRTFDDLIEAVATALEGASGEALRLQLRRQYRAALVDEFQDTDARQWSIFRRVFGAADAMTGADPDVSEWTVDAATGAHEPRLLALVGDPKQAIYRFRGGDVHTYLRARAVAFEAPPLTRNFRSRPALLRTLASLYERAGADAFVEPGIAFRTVEPGGRRDDASFLRDGLPAPALTVRLLPTPEHGGPLSAGLSRKLAARVCVEDIHALLAASARGDCSVDGRAVTPGDIAVLVRTHDEAQRIQRGLATAGIPAVTAGRSSLFATGQARELLTLFEALRVPNDARRLHAALATVLLGFDAAHIDALAQDATLAARQFEHALAWRQRWLRQGPLALVGDLCARNAPRLLELADGERRLSDFMQLGEVLQQAAQGVAPDTLVEWLHGRIASADDRDREQQLRLESDAARVQILTVHASKGLEFPFVFLPFAGIGAGSKTRRWCTTHHADGRVLHLQPDDSHRAQAQLEERAEQARLLYVALTRAQHAVWITAGPLYRHAETPLAAMLQPLESLESLESLHDDAISIDVRAPCDAPLAALPASAVADPPVARSAVRLLARDWSVYSFSALARQPSGPIEALLPEVAAAAGFSPVPSIPAVDFDPRFVGARFGDVVHAAFETVDFDAWSRWRDGAPPAGQSQALEVALRAGGYAQEEFADGVALLSQLVGRTLTATLPEGARLCDVPVSQRRAEMEFHFDLRRVGVDALLGIAQSHGLLASRDGFGSRRTLDGLMTGKIDLVYAHGGRYYVLDYKTNRLLDYAPAALERAMHEGEYTLQALIYSLALHRWLRFRLGTGYDYRTTVGGIRYVFCRGLATTGEGVYAHRLPQALIESVDQLFAGAGS